MNINITNFSNNTLKDTSHIVHQSDNKSLHEVTELVCIGQDKNQPYFDLLPLFV